MTVQLLRRPLALTMGDPAGVGPEICARALADEVVQAAARCELYCDARVMGEAAERVAAGEVTRAVRASDTAVGPVVPGDWIGLSRTGVVSVATSLADATSQLIERLLEPGREIVTLIEGAGSSAAETRRVTEWLHAEHPELTVELHHGGQPLYPFLVSIE